MREPFVFPDRAHRVSLLTKASRSDGMVRAIQRGADMITDDDKWESLAAAYLRRLAADDMFQWARHWKFEERSTGPDAEPQPEVSDTISKRERDRIKIMRITSRQAIPAKSEASAGLAIKNLGPCESRGH
jgi:hypothetical protein